MARNPVPSTWEKPLEHERAPVTIDKIRGQLTRPAHPNGAGILLIPSRGGVGRGDEEMANWLGDAGFTTLAWDPFSHWAPDISSEEKTQHIDGGDVPDAPSRAEHIKFLDYMEKELGLHSLGVTGTCMGGRMGLVAGAGDSRIKAASVFYASLRPQAKEWELDAATECTEMETKVQIHYPKDDNVTPYQRILDTRLVLEARPGLPSTTVTVYPQAHHGFLGLAPDRPAADLAATHLAWPSTIAFFRATLLE